jgi:hypothetical protein
MSAVNVDLAHATGEKRAVIGGGATIAPDFLS